MEVEKRGLHQGQEAWISAVNARDLARLLTLMTGDVVFLSPGQVPAGRQDSPAASSAAGSWLGMLIR